MDAAGNPWRSGSSRAAGAAAAWAHAGAGGGLTVEGNFHLTRGETEGLAAQLT
jgi:hypothetical protein